MAVGVEAGLTTEALLRERLAERRAQQKFSPGEIRLSELGGCPRKTTLRLLGYEPAATTDQQEAIFAAGDEAEEYIAALWRERFPRQVRRQVPVEWSLPDGTKGTGHIDLWVSPLRLIVECKSTRAAGRRYLPHEEHVDQVTSYLHHWGLRHGARAEISYYLKETGEILSFPVPYDRARAERLIAKTQAIAAAVRAQTPLPIPEGYTPTTFPCGWTTQDGQVATCPFWSYCWAEGNVSLRTTNEELPRVDALAEAAELLAEAESEYRLATEEAKRAEKKRDAARSIVAEWMERNHVEAFMAGRWIVRRTVRKSSVWYDVRAAIAAGAVSEAALHPFARERSGGEIWSVREVR